MTAINEKDLDEAYSRVAQLEELIENYARHDPGCRMFYGGCICGLNDALRELGLPKVGGK